jgi:hypothetical protein
VLDHGGGAGLWSHLVGQARFLYFIGASVTVQREGWVDRLSERIRAESGREHQVVKNAMGGVGMVFGLANYRPPPLPRADCVAFIEFSTGDLNGLTPIDRLPGLLRRLMSRCVQDHQHTVVVHTWRADQPSDDRMGIRRIYDQVAAEFGIPVIRNDAMAAERLAHDQALQAQWFRDVCHTHPPGAAAYAQHVIDALRSIDGDPAAPPRALRPVDAELACFLGGFEALASAPPARAVDYTYAGTGEAFPALDLPAGHGVRFVADGELLSVAFLSGPRSGWVEMRIDGRPVRTFRCFDRHSHYERYILLPAFFTLSGSLVELTCTSEPVDFSIASKPHPDFELPRTMSLVHLAGVGLRARELALLMP